MKKGETATVMVDSGVMLPCGIQALRRFWLENTLPVHPATFELLVAQLNRCAGENGKVARCGRCWHEEECVERFDAICGKVAMY